MIELVATDAGVLLPIRVTPKARHASIGGEHDGALIVTVTEAADKGKANRSVLKSLAKFLGTSPSQLSIVRGHTARQKTILVTSLTLDALRQRLKRSHQQ